MPDFRVIVKRGTAAFGLPSSDFPRVKSQNAAHAAACGLSLAGGGYAEVIEVEALQPVPGRAPFQHFHGCAQGTYGFCYTSRSVLQGVKGGKSNEH